MDKYDIGIIGAGVGGVFAALRLAESHKNIKTILFDLGRPPGKRRRQLEGWFGCFPTGDGKIYTNDIDKVLDIVDGRRAKAINRWVMKRLREVNQNKIIKNKNPSISLQKKIKEANFEIQPNNFMQWRPDSIHQLSRIIADKIEDAGNVTFSFDNEVYGFLKKRNCFHITTAEGDFQCKRIILCVGRSGWRWINRIYRELGILVRDDIAKFGVCVELSAQYMKDFNKSHCTLIRDDVEIGPFSWNGSIIQEDHADLTISAFRSNEDRWRSDKVFFSIIGKKYFQDNGCKQTDRLGKLAFLLAGDRVSREKIRSFMRNDSQLNLIPEYSWLSNTIKEISEFVPSIISRGYFHYPDIFPLTSEIKLGNNLESEVNGLYIAGESAGISGIAAAAIMGGVAAESASK